MLPVLEVPAHVLHLAGVDVGQAHLHGDGEVDDDVVGLRRLQHVQHRVADGQGVLRLRAGEALRGVLEAEIALVLRREALDQPRPLHGDVHDLLPGPAEDLLPLGHAHGVVDVDDGAGRARAGLKGLSDDVLPALGQDLDRHVRGDHVLLDEGAQKLILRL
jgi:hypothetical protein